MLDRRPPAGPAPDPPRPLVRPRSAGITIDRVGHRPSPPLRVARAPDPRRHRRDRPVPRRHAVPGAYVLGQRFQHHRNSNFIDGVGRDARYVAEHICHDSRRDYASANSTPPPEASPPMNTEQTHRGSIRSNSRTPSLHDGAAYDVIVVGARARRSRRRRCCSLAPGCGPCCSTAAAWVPTRSVDPRHDAWWCAPAGSLGTARRDRRRRHTAGEAHDVPCTATSRVVIDIKPAHGVDALYAPRRTLLDPLLVRAPLAEPASTCTTRRRCST